MKPSQQVPSNAANKIQQTATVFEIFGGHSARQQQEKNKKQSKTKTLGPFKFVNQVQV